MSARTSASKKTVLLIANGSKLKMDLGRAGVVKLPKKETQRRWDETTVQWPIMHAGDDITFVVAKLCLRHRGLRRGSRSLNNLNLPPAPMPHLSAPGVALQN